MDPDEEYIDEESDFESSDIEEDKEINEKKKNIKIGDDIDNEELEEEELEDDLDLDDIDDDDDNESILDLINDENEDSAPNTFTKTDKSRQFQLSDDDDSDDEDDENYLQKFDESLESNIISEFYPELHAHNYEEVQNLSKVIRNKDGEIVDPLHTTLPFITRYEKARIIGERTKQLNAGANPFVQVEPSVIDGYLIALKEFDEKKIPFIIKRPLPNGSCEYWKMSDLEVLI
jgi:DNA-directed RNA polymerase I, II, and III subunit RPABC2